MSELESLLKELAEALFWISESGQGNNVSVNRAYVTELYFKVEDYRAKLKETQRK